jgi:hypothetical protein
MHVFHVKPYFDEKLVAETSPDTFLLVSLRIIISSFPVIHIIHLYSYTFRLFILHMLRGLCEFTNEEFKNKIIYKMITTHSFPSTLSVPAI